MQQASDCDIVLAHDNDLVTIAGFGHDTVSRLLSTVLATLTPHAISLLKPSNQM